MARCGQHPVDHHPSNGFRVEFARGRARKVTVRPVIDLNAEMSTDGCTPTDRMVGRSGSASPGCRSPAAHPLRPGHRRPGGKHKEGTWDADEHRSDLDHRQSGPKGRRCRQACTRPAECHRLKTFTDWTYAYSPATRVHLNQPARPPPPTPAAADGPATPWLLPATPEPAGTLYAHHVRGLSRASHCGG